MIRIHKALPQQHTAYHTSMQALPAPALAHVQHTPYALAPHAINSCHNHFGSCHNYYDTYHSPYDGFGFLC